MTPLEAEADFDAWWSRDIKGDWTSTGIYELVKLAWMAGFQHHRELVRDAELHREKRNDGKEYYVAEVEPLQQPGGLRGGSRGGEGSGGRA